MEEQFERSALLLGGHAVERLKKARVAVFGVGGVGSFAVEALARAGIGELHLIDNDTVAPSNINRQLIATSKTVGRKKVDVAMERVLEINPGATVRGYACFYTPENAGQFDFTIYDYIVDAIDTVTSKLELVERAYRAGVPVISCMGAGNKLDPTAFEVADVYKTSVCPLARVMRRELKKRGVPGLKVVYSREEPLKPVSSAQVSEQARPVPGSVPFVPSVAGLILAGEAVKDLIKETRAKS